MHDWELALERWQGANLIDAAAAERIRLFEESRTPDLSPPAAIATAPGDRTPGDQASAPRAPGLRWPAIVALVFGGLMLGAGVLLFVAAHWDNLSPRERFALVVGLVAVFHAAGALASARKGESFAIVMHGLGTASVGAAIFLTGQIFNLQAHWPSGVMLWAAAAWIGYALRRDWVQFALAAMLTPSWLAGEWIESFFKVDQSIHVFRVLVEGMLLLSITYFAARSRELDSPVRRALVWIGGIAFLPYAVVLAIEREAVSGVGSARWQPLGAREIVGYTVAFGLPLALAWWLRGRDMWMNLIAAAWVFLLSLIALHSTVGVYAWCGLGAAGLVAWGVRDTRSERVNMGMAGFAITLFCFYFSEVMDKLDRSASLIGLGVLFLAGGWGLERLRRRFVARTRGTL
jgi:Predicted membrane protein (DUF2157)